VDELLAQSARQQDLVATKEKENIQNRSSLLRLQGEHIREAEDRRHEDRGRQGQRRDSRQVEGQVEEARQAAHEGVGRPGGEALSGGGGGGRDDGQAAQDAHEAHQSSVEDEERTIRLLTGSEQDERDQATSVL
jgi:hypothetical protein